MKARGQPLIVADEDQRAATGGALTQQQVHEAKELNHLLKPTNVSVVGSIKTITPILKATEVWVETNGAITYDARRLTAIPIRVIGRIEKLMIKYNFQFVHKGDKILEIYSPELLKAQRELINIIKSDDENISLIKTIKEKLILLGVTDSQIKQIIATKKEMYSFPMYSLVEGYIIEPTSLGGSTTSSTTVLPEMNEASSMPLYAIPSSSKVGRIQIREGMYVTSGQTIFNVVNTDQVWAEFSVRQDEINQIKVNDSINLSIGQKEIKSKVNIIQSFYQEDEKFTKVRIYLANPDHQYKIGELIVGRIKTESQPLPHNSYRWISFCRFIHCSGNCDLY